MNCKIKAATPKGPLDEHPKFADWRYWPSEKEYKYACEGWFWLNNNSTMPLQSNKITTNILELVLKNTNLPSHSHARVKYLYTIFFYKDF